MDDIQRRADDEAWDEKQDRWISDAHRRIEDGLSGDALAFAIKVRHSHATKPDPRDNRTTASELSLFHTC